MADSKSNEGQVVSGVPHGSLLFSLCFRSKRSDQYFHVLFADDVMKCGVKRVEVH